MPWVWRSRVTCAGFDGEHRNQAVTDTDIKARNDSARTTSTHSGTTHVQLARARRGRTACLPRPVRWHGPCRTAAVSHWLNRQCRVAHESARVIDKSREDSRYECSAKADVKQA